MTEIARELGEVGLENIRDPNLGGTVAFDWGSIKMVPAWHTSTTPTWTVNTPAGVIVTIGDRTVYHLGDTALFGDMELIGRRHAIDVALMCIGGHYTMDRHDAVEAARRIGALQVIPCHYNTFPLIATDAQAFQADVAAAGAGEVVLEPGERHSL
jgi:L-ascorbate metabolism protein UlaG (beta-lactamase superfamily)